MTASDLSELRKVVTYLLQLYERLDLMDVELAQPKPNIEQLQGHMLNVQNSQEQLMEALRPIANKMNRMVTNM